MTRPDPASPDLIKLDLIGLGECMIELSADAPLGTAPSLRRAYGGDILNALVTASRLGSRTGFITRVGNDPFGPALLEAWQAENIDTRCAPLVPGGNGVYFISLLPGGEREFSYRRAGSAASTLAPEQLDPAYIASARWLLLSGITQAISPSARRATLEAARLARAAGRRVAYDPNHRPRLWAAHGGPAAARDAFLELASHIDLLLPSFPADLEFLTPEPVSADAALRLLSAFAPVVAMKAAHEGAYLLAGGRTQHVPAAPTPRILDTTGAGDAWNGALLHAIARGDNPNHAAQLANRIAAAKLQHPGAIPPRNSTSPAWTSSPPGCRGRRRRRGGGAAARDVLEQLGPGALHQRAHGVGNSGLRLVSGRLERPQPVRSPRSGSRCGPGSPAARSEPFDRDSVAPFA